MEEKKESTFYGFHFRKGMKEEVIALAALKGVTKTTLINDALQKEIDANRTAVNAILDLKKNVKN